MKKALYWLATWIELFFANVWRKNDYYSPQGRISIGFAAFIAKTVACLSTELRRA